MTKISLSTIFAAALLLSGCVAGKLTFMVGGNTNEINYWEEVIKDFEKDKKIHVEILRSPTDTEGRKQALLTALQGRLPDPDVMLLDIAWIGQLASADWLEPLQPYNIDATPFFNSIIKSADTWRNHLIALPLYVDGGVLYYRADLLAKYGFQSPPETWKQLTDMAEKVQAAERKSNTGFWGFAWEDSQGEGLVCAALEFFVSAGGGFVDGAGRPEIDTPGNAEALKLMVSLVGEKKLSPPGGGGAMRQEEVRQLFQNGNALFERNWPYAFALHNDAASPVKDRFSIAPMPHFEGKNSASTLGGWHVAVSRYSDRKEDAVKFLQYITSYKVQKNLFLKLAWNPARMDVYADDEINSVAPHLKLLQKVFMNTVPRPGGDSYAVMSLVLQSNITLALDGKVKPDEALKTAQSLLTNRQAPKDGHNK